MKTWTDSWGVGWVLELEGMVPFPKINPLLDIRRVDEFHFPDPGSLVFSEDVKAVLENITRENHVLIGSMPYFIFERAWALMGMENFFISMMDYPEEIQFLLHKLAIYAKDVFARYIDLGFDGITFSEDLGSQKALLFSPNAFRKLFIPEYEYCFADLIEAGVIIDFHSCGCIQDISYDLVELGITILNPIQAHANNLLTVKDASRGKVTLSGGIDTDVILRGSPEEVRSEASGVLPLLKKDGGYIYGPDQWFPDFPAENLKALIDVWNQDGWY
ncbi:MAG: hypothetical protein KAH21_00190 [Spirochaetaceae bacterium]|nr:hypothetical protein [Spirochaetaceae bacterium]